MHDYTSCSQRTVGTADLIAVLIAAVRGNFSAFSFTSPAVITDTNGETVEGGTFSATNFQTGVPYTWNLPNTSENTKYRICMGANKQMKLNFLEIEYK